MMTTMTTTRMMTTNHSYCSQKFWWLTVDLEKQQTLSCCSASPQRVDVDDLKLHSVGLFNTPSLINEREIMLSGNQVDSCYKTCWLPESNNLPSRRLIMGSNQLTHTSLISQPEVLHLILSSDCNMTCVYCCKQYSSAWKKDIINNGTYPVVVTDDRYTINNRDKILSRLSQQQIVNSDTVNVLLDEVKSILISSPKLESVIITGGETFLHHNLAQIVNNIPKNVSVSVWTGLGVNPTRFAKILNQLVQHPGLEIIISAENINTVYEFNRWGNSWKQFETNLKTLQDAKCNYSFNATISNLTLFGLADFYDYVGNTTVTFQPVTDPDFLAINVLDTNSKLEIAKLFNRLPIDLVKAIEHSFEINPTDLQRKNLSRYIQEFSQRRSLSLNVFPESFNKWIVYGQ